MGLSIPWGQLQCFSVVGQGELVPSLIVIRECECVVKLRVDRVELQCLVQVFDSRLTGAYGEILQRSGVVFSGRVSLESLTLRPGAAREGDEAEWEQPEELPDAQGEESSPHHDVRG